MAEGKKHITGRGGRFFKLGGLSARVATSYLGERIKGTFLSDEKVRESLIKTNIVNATRVVEAFGQLKGAVMKLGQQMSLAADILPPEVTQILSKLQSSAPPVPFGDLRAMLAEELGADPAEVFESIDEEAYASASIGQVHRARMKDGREVVVKIQYPGIDQMVESDIGNLRSLAKTLGKAWFQGDAMQFFEELRERINEELDYRIEFENMLFFRRLFAPRSDVVIPEPVSGLCSRRVLVMEFVKGLSWDELCDGAVDQGRRNRFAAKLVDVLMWQFLGHSVMHADPHPGNYALDDKERLIIYDFGCVKHFSAEFMETYMETLRDAFNRNYDGLAASSARMGLVCKAKKQPGPEFYREICDMVMAPFHSTEPYAMHSSEIHNELQRWGRSNFMTLLQFAAPAQILMHDRVVVGMYGNLRRLKAEHRWGDLLRPYL
ncbi:MAG: AarF/ABC1/UbiB kinase family protein [Myxococcota bacterium]|jgi:predicted unusual protein kinase regulating ubiquinone biosynthesis (AarF/ABC1/UbiB family)